MMICAWNGLLTGWLAVLLAKASPPWKIARRRCVIMLVNVGRPLPVAIMTNCPVRGDALKYFWRWGNGRRNDARLSFKRAIQQGVDFLLSVDPAEANYPTRNNQKPSKNWWKFGFPIFYVADLLYLVEVLVRLGYGADPRLSRALSIIREKQDVDGRWALEYDYTGKTWVEFGVRQQPNKWVTLRALRVLKAISAGEQRH